MNPVEELRYLILGAQREGARMLHAAYRPYGITPAQAEVVDVLRTARRELTVKEIGDRLLSEQGSPSRLVNTLVSKGVLTTRRDPRDGRATAVDLTTKGHGIAVAIAEAKRVLDDRLALALDDEAAAHTRRLLRTLLKDSPAERALRRRLHDAAPRPDGARGEPPEA